jgi:hypothetical protein
VAHVISVLLSADLLIRCSKTAFLEEPILQIKPDIGLFIRSCVMRGPLFEKRILSHVASGKQRRSRDEKHLM